MEDIRDAIVSAIALLRVLKGVRIDSGNTQDDSEIHEVIERTEEQLSEALERIEKLQNDPRNN